MVSIMSKRPFGIHDMDIDVEVRSLLLVFPHANSTRCPWISTLCVLTRISYMTFRRNRHPVKQKEME